MVGVRKMVVVQNKIDVLDPTRAKVNYQEIREFTKDTVAGDAPVIPVSAHHKLNMDVLIAAIQEKIPTPKRDSSIAPRMSILRSFDVNKPGTEVDDLLGGVVGGSVVKVVFAGGEEIEIKPGSKVGESNRVAYERMVANVE